jgi:hypothetical protein
MRSIHFLQGTRPETGIECCGEELLGLEARMTFRGLSCFYRSVEKLVLKPAGVASFAANETNLRCYIGRGHWAGTISFQKEWFAPVAAESFLSHVSR